jgi:hypothetical protein
MHIAFLEETKAKRKIASKIALTGPHLASQDLTKTNLKFNAISVSALFGMTKNALREQCCLASLAISSKV